MRKMSYHNIKEKKKVSFTVYDSILFFFLHLRAFQSYGRCVCSFHVHTALLKTRIIIVAVKKGHFH